MDQKLKTINYGYTPKNGRSLTDVEHYSVYPLKKLAGKKKGISTSRHSFVVLKRRKGNMN